MRVITGLAKGKRLTAPEGQDTTRPTAEKVKEGVFSAIQFLLEEAEVLDLFAGSGQLGIEALSRGAKKAVFVDNAKEAVACIKENLANCGLSGKSYVHQTDVQSYLAGAKETFDIVFLDPPYADEAVPALLPKVEPLVKPGGIVFCEISKRSDLPESAGSLHFYKEYRYGRTKVVQFRREPGI